MDEIEGSKIIEEMVAGYGSKFSEEELWGIIPTEEDMQQMEAIIPAMGRYLASIDFMRHVTSGKAVARKRFYVIIQYFMSLGELLSRYQGKRRRVVVIGSDKRHLINHLHIIGTTPDEIKQSEYIEKFTDHDTAAAADYVKLKIAKVFPELKDQIEGVHFACTSEDVMGNVFGMIGNELVFGHFMNSLNDFIGDLVNYVLQYETVGSLIIPGLTHEQAAEPTTLGKKFITRIRAIEHLRWQLFYENGEPKSFSGKLGGAIGNLTCHYAAYPDINWWKFAKEFVESMGLHYEEMTDQCVSYVVEAHIFSTIAHILTQVIKLTKDFVNMASCPSQFFVKVKKEGQKGSSIMPNKSNAWGMEGAVGMLEEARSKLLFMAISLPDYPHEGNMKRSYLFRNIGDAFMPIFIALKRITREMKSYQPNQAKITAFFNEYPGMSGSSLQTVLKREGIAGDAYRTIQKISINSDSTYANAEQFRSGLEHKMEELSLPEDLREELRAILNPSYLISSVSIKVKDLLGVYKKRSKK